MCGWWSRWHVAALICISMLNSGCGGGERQPDRYPVRGSVVFKGKPTPHAIVCFIPADSDSDIEPAAGVVDDDGNFELRSRKHFPGAQPGDYLVTVSWQIPKNPHSNDDPEYGPELLPKKYSETKTSGLKATIEASDNELSPFELNP
jgi:hypothetical protein